MNELPCKFNPTGIICDGQTLCSFCGWNPQEAARRKQRIHALVNAGQRPHVVVRRPTLAEYAHDPHGAHAGGR